MFTIAFGVGMTLKYGDLDDYFCNANRNIKFEFACNPAYSNDDGNFTDMLLDASIN